MNETATTKSDETYSFKTMQYQRLGQLVRDCEYFLGVGAYHSQKYLYGGDPEKHAAEMLRVYKSLRKKPTWLCEKDITFFKSAMLSENGNPIFLDRPKKARMKTWLTNKGTVFVGQTLFDKPWFVEKYDVDGKQDVCALTIEGQPVFFFACGDEILEKIRRND